MSGAGVAEGFIGGTAVVALQKAAQEIGEVMGVLPPKVDEQTALIKALLEVANDIKQSLTQPEQHDVEHSESVGYGIPLKMYREGRSYYSMLNVGAAAIPVTAFIVGVGFYSTNLQPGWNSLDFPDGSEISLTNAGANVNVLVRKTNIKMGESI